MTQEEFLAGIESEYKKARELFEGKGEYDIYRGTAHAVSGYMEDTFAIYMANRIGIKEYQYLVDKLITYRDKNEAKAVTFKPDLAILEKGVLTHYYDLKTNLGWNRDLEKYLRNKNELIEKIRGKEGWITFPGKRQTIFNSENLKYQMVVFNGWNINQQILSDNVLFSSSLANVEIYILNTWDANTKTLNINQNAFDKLF